MKIHVLALATENKRDMVLNSLQLLIGLESGGGGGECHAVLCVCVAIETY